MQYLIGSALAILLSLVAWFFKVTWMGWGFFTAGLMAGIGLLALDERVLFRWYAPEASRTGAAAQTTVERITRSLLFVAVFVPLYGYVMSSSDVAFGRGVVLGMAVQYAAEWWVVSKGQLQYLYAAWQQRFERDELRLVRIGILAVFLILGILFA